MVATRLARAMDDAPVNWSASLEALRDHLGDLPEGPVEVSEWLAKNETKRPFVALCSGGADSVFLVLWLLHHPMVGRNLSLWHCDHATRGGASAADAAFVAAMAQSLDLPCTIVRLPEWHQAPNEGDLRHAREDRLRAYLRVERPAAVFTGHHADDVAENLLLRLARGSGLEGLSGLRPVQPLRDQPPRLRPMLAWNRGNLRDILARIGAGWKEDASNATGDYARNRIRLAVVPAWKQAIPERDILRGILRSHAELRAVHAWVETIVGDFLDREGDTPRLDRSSFEAFPHFLRERIWRAWVQRHLAKEAASAAVKLPWQENRSWRIVCGDAVIVSSTDSFSICPVAEDASPAIPATYHEELLPGEIVQLPGGGVVALREIELSVEQRERILDGRIPPATEVWIEGAALPLFVRGWKAGDRFHPLGAPGSRKLQDMFVDAVIERSRRHRLPIICDASQEIVWVPGLPPAHPRRLHAGSTRALWLTYIES